ncbi:MAG TPA: S8 family serine peptidase, partial [Phycisphaerales bacterium]|nr:S8 family serine peptidase [Phycisphaerales bacterium]
MPTSRNRGDSGTRFAQLELLEGRVLLSGGSDLNAQGAWDTHFIPWGNRVVEAVEDSWIMAFDAAVPHHVAMQRAQQVTAALGMPTTEIVPFAGNRYVRFESPAMMSRQQSEQVQNQFSFLRALQPNFIYHPTLLPNDPLIGQQYAVENTGQDIDGTLGLAGADMRLAEAWNISTGSLQVVIPIIDTGVDLLHPDLAANIWVNPGEVPGNNLDDDGNGFVDDVNGWDFTGNGDNNPTDEQGHGTAVAGCVGAIGNNGLGVAGVNWQVTLLPVKIFPAQGGASTQDIVEAVTYTTMLLRDFGVNIVASSNSYGAVQAEDPNFNDNAESLAIQEFTDAGGIFVAAAGNDTNDNDGPNFAYPASYNNEFIVSVAATDNRDELADFSNFGLTSVDVGAPGVRVMTTAMGGGYEYIDGTSFACPYTAGVLGLLASANAFASQQALRDALYQGVDRVAGLEGRVVTGGRVNAFESLKLVGFPGPIVSTVTPGALTGPVNQIQVQFSEPLNPAFFTPSGLELRGANGDRDFNANDVLIPFSAAFEPGNQVLTITVANGLLANDVYRVTLRHQFFRDMDGNFLNGTQLVGNDEEYDFEVVNNAGPFEPNDVLAQATPIIFGAAPAVMSGVIGDGANGVLDVDLYRLNLLGPSLITARIDARALESPSTLDSYLRLFDAAGREIARNDNFNGLDSLIQFFVPTGGRYYIGVTGFGNSTYSPSAPSSGTAGGSLGAYDLSVTVNTSTSEQVSFVNGIPVAIPATGTVSSSIFVPDVRPVQDVNVSISVTHTYVGDLRVRLISPSGKAVVLVLNRGGPGDNFLSTRFDDSAPGPISGGSAPFTGTFRPEEVLGDLNGDAAQGVWRLEILDSVPLNGGTLLSWQLDLRLENSISGPFEVNDTMLTATGLNFRGTRTFDGVIGDGAFGRRDVDMFRVVADAGTSISAAVTASGTLDAVLRLFDQQGNQLHIDNRTDSTGAFVSYPVQFAGVYFIAVSGAANTDYLPGSGGSGTAASGTGAYTLRVSIVGGISDGAFVLGGNRLSVGVATDGSLVTSGADQTGLNFAGIEFLNSGSAGESFYGATFNGFIFRNAGAVQSDLPVAVWNESDAANRRVSVEGLFRSAVASNDQNGGLLVRRSLSFGVGEQFIAIDVSLTNTTLGVLNSVAWVEGFKPVHPLNMGSLFSRTVTNRDNATGRLLTATFSDVNFPGGLTIGLGAAPPVGANFALSSEPSGLV